MPQVIITQNALNGLVRCRKFLSDKNPLAARRAAQVISHHFSLLEKHPEIGRKLTDVDLRELIIEFGSSGYLALYRFVEAADTAYILAFKHQKEVSY